MGRRRQAFTQEFIAAALHTYRTSHRPLHEVAAELGIAPSVLRKWHAHSHLYLREEIVTRAGVRIKVAVYGAFLLLGGVLVFIFERDRFTQLAVLAVTLLHVYVLATIAGKLYERRPPSRGLIAIALVLIAVDSVAWSLGWTELVAMGLVMMGVASLAILLIVTIFWQVQRLLR